jgi:hypothetical protein
MTLSGIEHVTCRFVSIVLLNKYEPNSKSKSMRWRQTISARRKLKKRMMSTGKNQDYNFFLWGEKDIIPVDIIPRAKTVNCDRYIGPTEILNSSLRLR